ENAAPTSHPPTFTIGSLVVSASEASLGVSGLSQSPKDLQNDPARLSPQTPRLWRRAGRAARSERYLAQPRVLTGQNGESPGGVTTEASC
ncbi:MAG: hypothetical protein ACO3JL_18200, partial [Myxococcota bacterium]